MEQKKPKHAFAVCAYKDSDYIEELFASLAAQHRKDSQILVATSTPTDALFEKSKRYGYPVHVNDRSEGIAADWDFAYGLAEADFVTLAHQDDIYEPAYTEKVLGLLEQSAAAGRNPILAYTNYFEIRDGVRIENNKLLRIKRMLNAPIGRFPGSRFVRNRVLSIGCPLSCPSVTFNKKRFPDFRFDASFRNNMDWEAWYRLAREQGDFIYVKDLLLGHRIHAASATTENIGDGDRVAEDLRMFEKYWPRGIAKLLNHFYKQSLKSNEMKTGTSL